MQFVDLFEFLAGVGHDRRRSGRLRRAAVASAVAQRPAHPYTGATVRGASAGGRRRRGNGGRIGRPQRPAHRQGSAARLPADRRQGRHPALARRRSPARVVGRVPVRRAAAASPGAAVTSAAIASAAASSCRSLSDSRERSMPFSLADRLVDSVGRDRGKAGIEQRARIVARFDAIDLDRIGLRRGIFGEVGKAVDRRAPGKPADR